MPAAYPINASPRHQLTTTKKRYVRQGILEDTTDIYWPIVTPLQDHTREKETHEVVDERIKKTWPKIQWWTIINA
jgi:hypothetical protein